jgi:hypothetical protein
MKHHWVLVIGVVALWTIVELRVTARAVDPDPIPRDRIFFQYNYYDQVPATPDQARLRAPFQNQDSTGLLAGNNLICFIDLSTGQTRLPFAVHSPPSRVPMNLVAGNWNNRLVTIVSPAEPSNLNPRVVALSPAQVLGDIQRVAGTSDAAISVAVGNFFGDPQPEVAYTTGAGPITRVTFGTLGHNTWYSFFPGGESYNGGARVAAGRWRNNGFDQLGVSMARGRVDLFELLEEFIDRIGTGYPVGELDITAGIDSFDANNDGRVDLLVGNTSTVTAIDLNNGATPIRLWQLQPFPGVVVTDGIQFNSGVAGGRLTIGAVNGPRLSIWSQHPETLAFEQTHTSTPFGATAQPFSFWAYDFVY